MSRLMPVLLVVIYLVGAFLLPSTTSTSPIKLKNNRLSSNNGTYSNPIIPDEDCPDPGAILYSYDHKQYYVASTTVANDRHAKFPIHASPDLVDWEFVTFVFPSKSYWPDWASGEDFWAPEIHRVNNRFVVYYTARNKDGVLCVGAAHSSDVVGPYKDSGKPLIHNATMGNIDSTFYQEAGKKYLIWKEDGNGARPPVPTPIWAAELEEDGLSVVHGFEWIELLRNDPDSWEGPLVEGPWIINHEGMYYLFYSANGYASDKYAVGVARSKTLLGRYEKYSQNPIVHSNDHWSGPGHCSVIQVASNSTEKMPSPIVNRKAMEAETPWAMIYHSWAYGKIGGDYPRLMVMDEVVWTSDNPPWPYIKSRSPSFGPTPLP